MKKIKVAHVLHCVGGVEVYLRLILENIDSSKFENIVLHGDNDTKQVFLNSNNVEVKQFKVGISREIKIITDFKAIVKCYKILKTEKPDLIHCHSAKGGILGRTLGLLLNTKVLFTPNAFSYLSEKEGFKRSLFLLIEKVFAKTNNVLLATSTSEINRGINEVGYKKDKTILFNNCINQINEIKSLSIAKTWPDEYICTVGRPSYQKNIELMINVFSELRKQKNIHLVIMGVGHHVGQLESVKKLIIDLDLSNNVTLLNWTTREDVLNIINNSKIYISTARYEGLPYSVIEALALSKPSVVSNCDGNKDLIVDNYNGFVIKNNNIKEYVSKINLLLNDKTLYLSFSNNAYDTFKKNHNIATNINLLEDIYLNNAKQNA